MNVSYLDFPGIPWDSLDFFPSAVANCHRQQNRASQRFSTVSGAPSVASNGTLPSGDPRLAEVHHLRDGLERLENKPLASQRFIPTAEKTEKLDKLALGAKMDRALGRRMTGQDAVMRNKPVLSEKAATST